MHDIFMSISNHKNRKYKIIPYDPAWVDVFGEEERILRLIFTDDAIAIEHIGSTSVPGLAGKQTVDVLVLVENVSVADRLKENMESAGYHALGEYVTKGARLFAKESDSVRICNVHIFQKDHPHVKEMLQLRDYLRTHQDVANEYSALKFELANKYSDDYGSYRKYKDAWMKVLQNKINTELLSK